MENPQDPTFAAIDQLLRLVVLDVMHASIMALVFVAAYLLVRRLTR
jgi:hypothetical protein